MKKGTALIRRWVIGGILSLACVTSFAQEREAEETDQGLKQMAAVFGTLNSFYVDSIKPSVLIRSGIEAMTSHLDPYTVFYPEENVDLLESQRTGEYAGVGAAFDLDGDTVIVSGLVPGAPFDKAGIRIGEQLLTLNNKEIRGIALEDLYEMIKGEPSSKLKVQIRNPWIQKDRVKRVKRQMVRMPAVPYFDRVGETIGYIRLSHFISGSSIEFAEAFETLQKNKGDLKGLIVDLRGNPGGLLKEAVQISGFFLPEGDTIVKIRGRMPGWTRNFISGKASLDNHIPLAVLINGHSASGAEVFAGAIQDQDRGLILGAHSFGKGLVQTTRRLPFDAKLKFTVARYYTPSGRSIQSLNYLHKGENGGPILFPDSLKKNFKTVHGRSVSDKGGISPDITLDAPEYLSSFASAILNENLIFKFSAQYAFENPKKPGIHQFEVDDQIYDQFKAYLKRFPVRQQSTSKNLLERFMANAVSEGYFDSVEVAYDKLMREVERYSTLPDPDAEEEVRNLLKEEILSCYYPQQGRIASGIEKDPVLSKAVELLRNAEEYEALLR